jgi:hypothetical protein
MVHVRFNDQCDEILPSHHWPDFRRHLLGESGLKSCLGN